MHHRAVKQEEVNNDEVTNNTIRLKYTFGVFKVLCAWWELRIRGIDLGCKDEVAFSQTLDLVGPHFDAHLSPCKVDIGMVVLILGDYTDPVCQFKCRGKVLQFQGSGQVVVVFDRPAVELGEQFVDLLPIKRRCTTLAGCTCTLCKCCIRHTPFIWEESG